MALNSECQSLFSEIRAFQSFFFFVCMCVNSLLCVLFSHKIGRSCLSQWYTLLVSASVLARRVAKVTKWVPAPENAK